MLKPLRISIRLAAGLFSLTAVLALAADRELHPLMNRPANVAYHSDFRNDGNLEKSAWQARQGTRWHIAEGVLRGTPSSAEYQAKKADHKGLEARIASSKTPQDFIARFSVRFIGGQPTSIVPFVEFGHHNVRLKLDGQGVQLLADHESLRLAQSEAVRFESGRWYHLLAEKHGNTFVVQFADGPTLLAEHPSLSKPVAAGADGLGVAGTRGGTVEIDDVTLWTIEDLPAEGWEAIRSQLPKSEPVSLSKN